VKGGTVDVDNHKSQIIVGRYERSWKERRVTAQQPTLRTTSAKHTRPIGKAASIRLRRN